MYRKKRLSTFLEFNEPEMEQWVCNLSRRFLKMVYLARSIWLWACLCLSIALYSTSWSSTSGGLLCSTFKVCMRWSSPHLSMSLISRYTKTTTPYTCTPLHRQHSLVHKAMYSTKQETQTINCFWTTFQFDLPLGLYSPCAGRTDNNSMRTGLVRSLLHTSTWFLRVNLGVSHAQYRIVL